MPLPRITFGIIVLNGEPFTRYCLRTLYPFAHQIIVVEGAVRSAETIATADGHSRDSTLETLYRFQREEDPEKKVEIISRPGFWPEKDELSQAYAEKATGDYLWQVDVDEFYRAEDVRKVMEWIEKDPSITAISFPQKSFWGGFDYTCDGPYLHQGFCEHGIHRVFRWGPGYRYLSHRPVTIEDDRGRNLHSLHWIRGEVMERLGIYMYHYSLVFPRQVREKCEYYSRADWTARQAATAWAEDVFFQLKKPFRVHNVYSYPSWLERFTGPHPEQIEALRNDLKTGEAGEEQRPVEDVERLLSSAWYRCGRFAVRHGWSAREGLRRYGRLFLAALRNPKWAASRVAARLGLSKEP